MVKPEYYRAKLPNWSKEPCKLSKAFVILNKAIGSQNVSSWNVLGFWPLPFPTPSLWLKWVCSQIWKMLEKMYEYFSRICHCFASPPHIGNSVFISRTQGEYHLNALWEGRRQNKNWKECGKHWASLHSKWTKGRIYLFDTIPLIYSTSVGTEVLFSWK